MIIMSPTRSVRLISRTVDRRHGRSRAQHEAYLLLPARRHDDCKTTRKISDPRVTKNYFRAHIAIMNPSHPDKRHASRAGCRAALQRAVCYESNSDHSCRNAAECGAQKMHFRGRTALGTRDGWGEVHGIARSGIHVHCWYPIYDPAGHEVDHASSAHWPTVLRKPHSSASRSSAF